MSEQITRRTAIITSLLALGGTPIYAKQQKDDTSAGFLNMVTPATIGIAVSLDTVQFLSVSRGKETVRIEADEIWKAINGTTTNG